MRLKGRKVGRTSDYSELVNLWPWIYIHTNSSFDDEMKWRDRWRFSTTEDLPCLIGFFTVDDSAWFVLNRKVLIPGAKSGNRHNFISSFDVREHNAFISFSCKLVGLPLPPVMKPNTCIRFLNLDSRKFVRWFSSDQLVWYSINKLYRWQRVVWLRT